jgi:hypothetical protein
MPSHELPERLRYLQPVVEQLDKLRPEEINEDIDIGLLEAAVKQRMEGMSDDDAKQVLKADRVAFFEYMKKADANQRSLNLIFGWFFAGAGQLSGYDDNIEYMSELISELPSPPPSRSFGPLPEIGLIERKTCDEDGNLFLYVRNNASEPSPIDLRVAIDGVDRFWDFIETDYNIYTRYRMHVQKGLHHLVAETQRGQSRIEEDFKIIKDLHIGITYWYSQPSCFDSEERPPALTFHATKKPWIPDYGWRPRT